MPRCPACFSPMTRIDEDSVRINTCPNCFGSWMQRVALLRATRQAAADAAHRSPDQIAADQADIAELAATVVESNTTKTLRCTDCHVALIKDRVNPLIPVTIDRCPKCSGIWLDVGEFSLIKKLTIELQNTTDPELIAKRDRLATIMMQWEGRPRGLEEAQEDVSRLSEGLNILTWVMRSI